jgi:ribosomal protein S18
MYYPTIPTKVLCRYLTGVCRKQQRKLEKAIEISRRLGKDELAKHGREILC